MFNENDSPQYDAHVKLHEVVADKRAVEQEWMEMENAAHDEYEAAVLVGYGDDEHLPQEDF